MENLIINSAILHIFDFPSRNVILSEETLNLEDKNLERYIRAHILKSMQDIRMTDGFFQEDSSFLNCIQQYSHDDINLLSFSKEIANTFFVPFENTIDKSFDALFCDYMYDEIHYLGLFLLESQKAITHYTQATENIYNTIVPSTCVLPSTSKKLNSFVYINLHTFSLKYCDETKWSDAIENFLKDQILKCTSEKSKKEILKEVQTIVEEVADQSNENPTVVLSKYKNFVKENCEVSDTLSFDSIAENVFPESKTLQEAFHSKAIEKELPKEVELPTQTVQRAMKNQRIKTDTGIELSFPTTYFQNPEIIEFINHPDGTISIEIKNIGK